jgi:hypothetical protein
MQHGHRGSQLAGVTATSFHSVDFELEAWCSGQGSVSRQMVAFVRRRRCCDEPLAEGALRGETITGRITPTQGELLLWDDLVSVAGSAKHLVFFGAQPYHTPVPKQESAFQPKAPVPSQIQAMHRHQPDTCHPSSAIRLGGHPFGTNSSKSGRDPQDNSGGLGSLPGAKCEGLVAGVGADPRGPDGRSDGCLRPLADWSTLGSPPSWGWPGRSCRTISRPLQQPARCGCPSLPSSSSPSSASRPSPSVSYSEAS